MTLSILDLLEQQLKIGQMHLDSSYIDDKINSLNNLPKLI